MLRALFCQRVALRLLHFEWSHECGAFFNATWPLLTRELLEIFASDMNLHLIFLSASDAL
jgi:hypothetical protein